MPSESTRKIARVGGMRDVLPDEYEARRVAWETIRNTFERFGYRGIEVPILEHVDLHLRKSGESIRRHMYVFEDLGHDTLCLRPEITASVVRMYNNEMSREPLPLKLFYFGSNFRYDRPQLGRYREFSQAGVEIIGAPGPEYDAQIIALACQVMNDLGIDNYEVVIGSIGLVWRLLETEQIEERVRNFIIEQLEELGKSEDPEKGLKEVEAGLGKIGVSFESLSDEDREILETVRRLPGEETRKLLSWLMKKVFVETAAARDFSEVADNLLAQVSRDRQGPKIRRILQFIAELREIAGRPEETIPRVRKLLEAYHVDAEPLDNLEAIAGYLESYGVDWSKTRIDFGFGRGLQYYTGMIFEIHCRIPELGPASQICGGGRYDALIKDLGASENRPALGFSFGMERLRLAMTGAPEPRHRLDVLVAPIGDRNIYQYAIRVSQAMRRQGLTVDIGPPGAKPRDLAGMAKRLGAKFAVFVGEDEVQRNVVAVKDMRTGRQEAYSVDEAVDAIRNLIGAS